MTARVRVLAGAAVAAALLGIGTGVGLHVVMRQSPPSAATSPPWPTLHGQAVWPASHVRAPAFTLRDQNGRLVSPASEHGHTVVLAFMDPLCKQECPIEGREFAVAEQQLAPAERSALLLVSVNPRATGADARRADRRWNLTGDVHWLLGDKQQLSRVWREYHIAVVQGPTDIVHTTAFFVIDRKGFERAGFMSPFLPQFLADDLRTLA